VILPAGKIATGKLVQAFAYGAKIVAIDGNFDDALRIVRELGESGDFTIVNSINPDRIAGQKTAAFEILDELGDAPDFHLLPVGNAGNITAYWAGYREYLAQERLPKLPVMIGFQAIGAAPIFHDRVIDKPETIASAIRIGNPAGWAQARAAIVDSQGGIDVVSDEDILAAQNWLAQHEGIFVEPASAASIAGLFKCCDSDDAAYSFRKIRQTSRIVCTDTGHGLKDPDVIIGQMSKLKPIAATVTDVRRAIEL
jgi:threonine synthase